jgi:hypothetical protein
MGLIMDLVPGWMFNPRSLSQRGSPRAFTARLAARPSSELGDTDAVRGPESPV